MSGTDWMVLVVTLVGMMAYGLYKSRTTKNLDGYFRSNQNLPWYMVLLSIMGTQASAVTFLSAPGQAYVDGMRFVQYYFGLPLAMVVICITFVPLFNKLNVYTAYAFLENRFDAKTRTLTSFLFLLQRGLSTGISIYAPSIILSTLFGWPIFWTNIVMGGLLIVYTVAGGAKAVAYTQQLQFLLIFLALFAAMYFILKLFPQDVGFIDALHIGGKLGKLNIITSGSEGGQFDWNDRYNIWSGVIGGFFLALSYFGADQSQVGRYLTARNNTESKLGLLMNGLVKIPMQAFILLLGVLVFAFYQFQGAPLSFNSRAVADVERVVSKDSLTQLQQSYDSISRLKQRTALAFTQAVNAGRPQEVEALTAELKTINAAADQHRAQFGAWGKQVSPQNANDTNYIFMAFVKDHLPAGLKGLLIAVIFLAGWGSIAAALNSLAASTVVDFHQRFSAPRDPANEYAVSRWYTFAWGVFCVVVAQFAYQIGTSLIEAVNVLGSLFYGVILGIFLVAFYVKRVGGPATFYAAVITEIFVVLLFFKKYIPPLRFLPDIGFLWLTAVGALALVLIGWLLQVLVFERRKSEPGRREP